MRNWVVGFLGIGEVGEGWMDTSEKKILGHPYSRFVWDCYDRDCYRATNDPRRSTS